MVTGSPPRQCAPPHAHELQGSGASWGQWGAAGRGCEAHLEKPMGPGGRARRAERQEVHVLHQRVHAGRGAGQHQALKEADAPVQPWQLRIVRVHDH